MTLMDLRDLLLTITPNVYHFDAGKATGNYIVWAEDGPGTTEHADDEVTCQGIQGTIDYFTKDEFDPMFDQIQAILNSSDLTWELNSIQHEKETGYIHYEWVFEVVNAIG